MSSSSLDEKEREIAMTDPQTAAQNPKQYEPIATEPMRGIGGENEKDLEANISRQNTRRRGTGLSRLESTTSGISSYVESVSDAKSSTIRSRKKKWYRNVNPLRWGEKPPVPEKRSVCPEYGASWFSLVTFQWMAPLMSVCVHACFYSP